MQRDRSAPYSFPERIDLNQGSFPSNTSMDHSTSWDDMLNPVENRLSNYMLASTDGNASCMTANDCAQSFSGWDLGESSSSMSNMQDGAFGDDSKMRLGWSPSFSACSGSETRSENWSFEPSNSGSTSYAGNQLTGRSLSMHNYSTNCGSLNVSSNHGLMREHDGHSGLGAGQPNSLCKSGHSEMEQIPTLYASPSNIETSSGSSLWGTSCKRKALEGTSGQFYQVGSSRSNEPMGKNIVQHPTPDCYTGQRNLCISSGLPNLSPSDHSEHLNPSRRIGAGRVAPAFFPSSRFPEIAESSARNFTMISNHRQESVPFDTHRGTSVRNHGLYAAQLSRPISNTDSSEWRPPTTPLMNQNNLNQPCITHVNEARGMHSYPWNESFSSRGGGSSSSFMVRGEPPGAREEVNVGNSHRSNLPYLTTVSSPEATNILQDQIDWSFAPGTSATSRNHSSGSQIGPSSGGRASSTTRLPYQNPISQNHPRWSESAPWIPFPRVEPESGFRRSHFVPLPSASSSDEAASSSRATQHRLHQNSAAILMDITGDDFNGRRAMAAVEGRQRLIRQVLSAMRRSGHVQAEDYMHIEPFVSGFAELHDRHRDMRLDVDNMSYEELLALEEQIGHVSTGLCEGKIRGSMRQRKQEAMGALPNLEPCCICQEDYLTGDDIGILDCGHEFHTNCIKQWLTLKNLCPICKMTALDT